MSDAEKVIDFVLHKNRDSLTSGMGSLSGETPVDALMRKEEGESSDEWKVRDEAFNRLMHFFFEDGPEPLAVIKRLFATAKAVAPHLLGDMSMEDIALLCGDGGRATVSARIKRIYSGKLERAGMRAVKAPCQKSADAVRKFREAQMGNTNRKKSQAARERRGK